LGQQIIAGSGDLLVDSRGIVQIERNLVGLLAASFLLSVVYFMYTVVVIVLGVRFMVLKDKPRKTLKIDLSARSPGEPLALFGHLDWVVEFMVVVVRTRT
jgi:hypothetical protein